MEAAIAMMVGGAVMTTFVGDSYLAKYLCIGSGNSALLEEERHDKALET